MDVRTAVCFIFLFARIVSGLSVCDMPICSCKENGGKMDIVCRCTEMLDTMILGSEGITELPPHTENLSVKQCQQVILDRHSKIRLSFLQLVDILYMKFAYNTSDMSIMTMADRVLLENIGMLQEIPKYGISRTSPMSSLVFRNITMEKIHSSAIQLVLTEAFIWDKISVSIMDFDAMTVNMNMGFLNIENSYFHTLEVSSISAQVPVLQFTKNIMHILYLGAFNISSNEFDFVNNTCYSIVMPQAFRVSSQKVKIIGNTFTYLQTGAFENIEPNLLKSNAFEYTFQNNYIASADPFSLHINWATAEKTNVTKLVITDNLFNCTCRALSWLSFVANSQEFGELQQFYMLYFKNNNTCDEKCKPPLEALNSLVNFDDTTEPCKTNLSSPDMCKLYEKPTPGIDSGSSYTHNHFPSLHITQIVIIIFLIRIFHYEI